MLGLLVVVSGIYALVEEYRLPVAEGEAFLVLALGLWSIGSIVALASCSAACGFFLDQGLNLCLLLWQVNSLPLSL